MRKEKEALIIQTCPLTIKLDDVSRWQGENKDSCQLTVGVDVTGIDVSSTVTMVHLIFKYINLND